MLYPSFFLLTIIFFLSLNLCSADRPSGPSRPTGPSGSGLSGWDCKFQPASGCGPDTTSPGYNACLVRDSSVSEFIQCANQTSTINSDDDSQSITISALDVLIKASTITACVHCTLGATLLDYSTSEKSVNLVNYLCGKASDRDVCCLSGCIGARQPEHSLVGICNNVVNLWDNKKICVGGSSTGGQGGGSDDNQGTTPSSPGVAITPTPTVNSTSSISTLHTTLPTSTPSSSPSRSTTSDADRNARDADILALKYLVVVLAVGVWRAV